MAFTGNAIANSWKAEILNGTHLLADIYKIALYTSSATFDKTSTVYSSTNEVANGNGYTTGGATLATPTIVQVGDRQLLKFGTDPSWASATFTARGAVIYNTSRTNKIVCVLDFGSDITATNGTFTVDLGNQNTTGASITFATTTLTRAAGDFVADGYKIGHTIVTSNATYPGPYTLTNVATTVLTISGSMGALGPVSADIGAVVIAL